VWDYPRPPRLESTAARLEVELAGRTVARTTRGWRVPETSHPPVYYVPRDDLADGVLERGSGGSWCEWKGAATYWDLVVDGRRVPQAAIVDDDVRAVRCLQHIDGLEEHDAVRHEMRPVAAAVGDHRAVESWSLDDAARYSRVAAANAVTFRRKLEAAGKIDPHLEHEFESGLHPLIHHITA